MIGGLRTKIVFVLVIYFAGFASAIYCLAPVPEKAAAQTGEKSFGYSVLKSDAFAQSFNVGMHKCLDFSKKAAQIIRHKKATQIIKQKLDDRQRETEG